MKRYRAITAFIFLSGFAVATLSFAQVVNPVLQMASDWAAGVAFYRSPDFLSFEELKSLYENPEPEGRLKRKLEKFWKTAIVSNEAYYRGVRAHRPEDPKLGDYLRVMSWNVEKSLHVEDLLRLISSEEDLREMLDSGKAAPDSEAYRQIKRQRERMLNADVVVLQEMDIGVKRSDYIDAARQIAQALEMNYAYAPEQLEIDPVILGLEKIYLEDGSVDEEATRYYKADPFFYKGVFGSAVLSRYPIKNVEVFQLKYQGYDWYWGEKEKTTFLEDARRFGAETVFENEITREIKVGGRIYFRVDLDVPDLPGGTLTVINIHLEIKCEPEAREAQMAEILGYVQKIKNPVIVAGDFNSAAVDLSPTSVPRAVKRTAKNPTTWFSAAVTYLSPYALIINTSRFISNFTKNFQDPTARSIPVIASNKVKGLFKAMEEFRADDGHVFDFRGDPKRTIHGNAGTLANSNQRDFKGFKTTFSVRRPIGGLVGKYRLDWFFVKSFLKDPRNARGSYRFAPHFGESLEEMNTALKQLISDHHPNVVDLPFEEPKL